MRNKDIIKQYVNTGKLLPETQLKKLNNSLLKSYFRARIRTHRAFILYEFDIASDIIKNEYINSKILLIYEDSDEIIEDADMYGGLLTQAYGFRGFFTTKTNVIYTYLPVFLKNELFYKMLNMHTVKHILHNVNDVRRIIEILGNKYEKYSEEYLSERREKLIFAAKCKDMTGVFKLFNINIDEYTDELLFYVFTFTEDVNKMLEFFGEKADLFFHNLSEDVFRRMFVYSSDKRVLSDTYQYFKKK